MSKAVYKDSPAWLRPFELSDVLMPGALEFARAEQKASTIRHISTLLVPGILQTEQYMVAALRLWPGTHPLSSGAPNKDFVKFRLGRQWQLFERQKVPAIQIIIDEISLIRRVGSPQIMYGQLRHLQKVSKMPNITLQLLPVATQLSPASAMGALSATLLSFGADEPEMLSSENPDGSLNNSLNSSDTRMFKMEFMNLQAKALSVANTNKYIEELASTILEKSK